MRTACAREVDGLIEEMDRAPGQTAFYDLAAAAEVLALCGQYPSAAAMRARIAAAALGWLRAGLLDDTAFARLEFLYPTSLLCWFASRAPGFVPKDVGHTREIVARGLAGRSELPVLTSQLVASYLAACGIEPGADMLGTRDLRLVLDKRVLRARSDDFDVLTLTLVAQLCAVSAQYRGRLPRMYPQALLVQAVRDGHANWVAVLTLLCATAYGMPDWLREGAARSLASHVDAARDLLPPPEASYADNDYVQRAEKGLRLRSSIAAFAVLHDA
ncbi:MAG TPA: hypothetical protein VFE05_23680 [Longimicrobiaceae bacterium]|nr:hypothetical protein [Longimicrobiaceae bacterium]